MIFHLLLSYPTSAKIYICSQRQHHTSVISDAHYLDSHYPNLTANPVFLRVLISLSILTLHFKGELPMQKRSDNSLLFNRELVCSNFFGKKKLLFTTFLYRDCTASVIEGKKKRIFTTFLKRRDLGPVVEIKRT